MGIRRNIRTKIGTLMICVLFCCICGCGYQKEKTSSANMEESTKKIVVLGKESYVYSDEALVRGIEMAMEELEQEGIELTWEHIDDNGEYETGISYGGQAAKDDSVLAVLTVQDFDVIDALAPVYEEAKKPFISIQGCNESTLQEGYQYFFCAFTSAEDMGRAVADYCGKKAYERVVCSHTGTTFELSEMRGFQRNASQNNVNIVDMIQGPSTMTELKSTCYRWETLQVDAVYLAHLTYSDTSWMLDIIRYLKEQNPKLQILSDYSLNHGETLETHGDILEGVVIPAPYSVEENELTKEFRKRYEEKYGTSISNVAMQGYDLVHIFGGLLREGCTDTEKMMEQLKRSEGFEGTTGHIHFTKNGKLTGIAPQYLVVRDKKFVLVK